MQERTGTTHEGYFTLPPSHRAAVWFSCVVLAISILDLAGWIWHFTLLTSIVPHYATMKSNTAVSLALLAISILFKVRFKAIPQTKGRRSRPGIASILGSVFAALPIPIAVARILESITGRDLGFDRFILRIGADQHAHIAGRTSLGTPLCLLLVAAALLFLDWMPRLSMGFLLTSCAVSLSAVIAFVFDVGPVFAPFLLRVLALPTAASLLMLQSAAFTLRPEREPFISMSHVNRSGRRQWLLLGVTVVPAIVAFPLLIGMKSGVMDAPFALALLVVVLISIQTIILWQDSKALRQVEGRRNLAEQALLQSEKLAVVGRLAASISHEINNPLEAIGNILYLVRNADSLDAAREYALMAEQELSRVAQITTQTLSFYRENRQPALYQPTAIVDSALTLLGGKINSSRVQVKVDFRDDVQPVRCRDGELRQVVVNLISNAIEATPAGGHVVVRVQPSVAWPSSGAIPGVRILVADSGRGIPPAYRERIFEPFFTTKAHETGNGLGLWVVKDLVEKQRGVMQMRSGTLRGWQGTTFSVFLPYDSPDPTVPEDTYRAGAATAAAAGPA